MKKKPKKSDGKFFRDCVIVFLVIIALCLFSTYYFQNQNIILESQLNECNDKLNTSEMQLDFAVGAVISFAMQNNISYIDFMENYTNNYIGRQR